jgi:hypothetical protein
MEKYFYNQDDYSADSRQSVNGAWKPLGASFDGDDYDNFLTKKSRERGKERRELRKSGVSRKDARKQALAQIPKDKAKDIAKKVAQGVGKGILKGTLSAPRGAYLSLIAINYRGNAYKLMAIINGRDNGLKDALKKKWEGLGGNYDKLVKSATNGATKKPFFCGKKCNQSLANADLKKITKPSDSNFSGFNAMPMCNCGRCKRCYMRNQFVGDEFLNVTGVEEVGVGVWIGLASTMIGAMSTIVGKGIESRSEKRAIESAELIALKENESLSKAEKDKIALQEKELASEGDATNIILNNPNLTPEERAIALKQLDEAEGQETKRNVGKFLLYGGIVVLGYFIVTKFINKK